MNKHGKTVSLIAAVYHDNVIGVGNKLPRHIPGELRGFKKQTMGRDVIVGHRTFDSILQNTKGALLPGRHVIVLSSKSFPTRSRFTIARDPEDALRYARQSNEVFVAGGGKVYEAFLPFADRMYLTHVNATVENGQDKELVYFPKWNKEEWSVLPLGTYAATADCPALERVILERRV